MRLVNLTYQLLHYIYIHFRTGFFLVMFSVSETPEDAIQFSRALLRGWPCNHVSDQILSPKDRSRLYRGSLTGMNLGKFDSLFFQFIYLQYWFSFIFFWQKTIQNKSYPSITCYKSYCRSSQLEHWSHDCKVVSLNPILAIACLFVYFFHSKGPRLSNSVSEEQYCITQNGSPSYDVSKRT